MPLWPTYFVCEHLVPTVCLSKSELLTSHTASQDHLPPWSHDKLSEHCLPSDWPFSIIQLQSSSVLNNRFPLKMAPGSCPPCHTECQMCFDACEGVWAFSKGRNLVSFTRAFKLDFWGDVLLFHSTLGNFMLRTVCGLASLLYFPIILPQFEY